MRLRRLRPLVPSDLAHLPLACDCCGVGELLTADLAWARAAVDRFGLCGVACMDADEPQGWLLLSTALNLPDGHPLSGVPRAADAAQLVQVRVQPQWRGIGVGRQLVQAAAARLSGHVSYIDALAHPTTGTCGQPPASWLLSVGFQGIDEPAGLLTAQPMRLDLARTVRWRPVMRGALDRLAGLARPASGNQPVPSTRGGAAMASEATPPTPARAQ